MNLAPGYVEHAHGDGVRRPVDISDKRDCAGDLPRVGMQLAEYGPVTVQELNSILHRRETLSRSLRGAGRRERFSGSLDGPSRRATPAPSTAGYSVNS